MSVEKWITELNDGDPIEYRTAKGWRHAKFRGAMSIGKSVYISILPKTHRLPIYITADSIRRPTVTFEDNNPNRTFKSREEG